MKRGARDSQVVNNFFTFASIVIISIVIILYTNYVVKDPTKEPHQLDKIQCEKDSLTKVTIPNIKLLKKSIKALDKGYYQVEGSFLELEDKESTFKKVVSIKELEEFYKSLIGVNPKKELEKHVNIRFELIENSKKDSLDLGAGKLISSFRINSNELFRFESEIKFIYKNAIKDRIDCSMKVYKNYVEN